MAFLKPLESGALDKFDTKFGFVFALLAHDGLSLLRTVATGRRAVMPVSLSANLGSYRLAFDRGSGGVAPVTVIPPILPRAQRDRREGGMREIG
ncbi:MAG: hypothetical protein ABJ082_10725, partial [Parasphingorhabdus sp.]